MPLSFENDVLPETTGLRLCKMVGDDLRLAEEIQFPAGRQAVLTVLNRASIAGHVGGSIDQTSNWWADQMDADGSLIGEICLDRRSWNSLKNRWMRCRMQSQ